LNRRAITTRGAVRVDSQLKSHKRFASAFERYCQLVDNARLYCTNSVGAPPSVSTTLPSGLSAMHPVLLLFFLVVPGTHKCTTPQIS